MLLNEKECKRICERLLELTSADDAHVSVRSTEQMHQRFAANAFTTDAHAATTSVTVTAWIGRRKGSASTTEVDDAGLQRVVRDAENTARLSPVDVEYVPTLGPQKYRPTNGFVNGSISAEKRARLIDSVIGRCEKHGLIGAGLHQASAIREASATGNGNFHLDSHTAASLSATARSKDGQSSGYCLRSHVDAEKLDGAEVARVAIDKALASRDAQVLPPGVYPVILEPEAAENILKSFEGAFTARRADEGRSPVSAPGGGTRVGERLFDEKVNFFSDPWNPLLPGPSAAQDGLPAEKLHLVRNGVVENLVYSRHWAREKGKRATAGPVNRILQGSAPGQSLEKLIASTERALLVTRFWYIRSVNPQTLLLTGLTRDGVWLIENGKIRHAVRNFRFNQSVMEMLAPGNVEAIGEPVRTGGDDGRNSAGLFPALKLRAFNFSSASDAV